MEHRRCNNSIGTTESGAQAWPQHQYFLRRSDSHGEPESGNIGAFVRCVSRRAPHQRGDSRQIWQSTDERPNCDIFLQADLGKQLAADNRSSDVTLPGNHPAHDKLFEALATAVIVLDHADCVTFMNTAAEGLLGVSLKRAVGHSLAGLVPGIEMLLELCPRARASKQSFGQTLHITGPLRDGQELELAARIGPYTEGGADALLIELFDITRRHQLDKESALVAQRGVSQRMLRQLAHEIRNPLGGLRGAAQLLEAELDDPELHEFTRVIIGEADRLEGLVAGLLGPRERPDMQEINVHEVLEHVARIACSESPGLSLERDYDPSLPALLMDRDQITQAVLNLVRNASQATGGTGSLRLRTRIKSNHVLSARVHKLVAVIDIEDDGPGVPDDIAGTIFYPLVTGRLEGTGIGLPLAQELVNRHEGLIEFSSEAGKTVFSVSLPVRTSEVPRA